MFKRKYVFGQIQLGNELCDNNRPNNKRRIKSN